MSSLVSLRQFEIAFGSQKLCHSGLATMLRPAVVNEKVFLDKSIWSCCKLPSSKAGLLTLSVHNCKKSEKKKTEK